MKRFRLHHALRAVFMSAVLAVLFLTGCSSAAGGSSTSALSVEPSLTVTRTAIDGTAAQKKAWLEAIQEAQPSFALDDASELQMEQWELNATFENTKSLTSYPFSAAATFSVCIYQDQWAIFAVSDTSVESLSGLLSEQTAWSDASLCEFVPQTETIPLVLARSGFVLAENEQLNAFKTFDLSFAL